MAVSDGEGQVGEGRVEECLKTSLAQGKIKSKTCQKVGNGSNFIAF